MIDPRLGVGIGHVSAQTTRVANNPVLGLENGNVRAVDIRSSVILAKRAKRQLIALIRIIPCRGAIIKVVVSLQRRKYLGCISLTSRRSTRCARPPRRHDFQRIGPTAQSPMRACEAQWRSGKKRVVKDVRRHASASTQTAASRDDGRGCARCVGGRGGEGRPETAKITIDFALLAS